MGLIEGALIVIVLLAILYRYLVSNYDYWKSRGVKGPKPVIVMGTLMDVITNKISLGCYVSSIYENYKNEAYTGLYMHRKPILLLNNLDLVKDVLIRNFSKFADRGATIHDKIEPLAAHLFNLEARRWRPLRLKLSPVFTSGRLKEMFYLLDECGEHLQKYVSDLLAKQNGDEHTIEFRELTAKFTTDVIGVCAFGLRMNALASEDSPFRVMGRRIFSNNWQRVLQNRLRTMAPKIYGVVGHFLADREMNNFFIDMMKQTMNYRKENGVVKHDFIDLLMAIKDQPDELAEIELTDPLLAAQLFVFFIAGFETSSSTMSNAFYELALNPKCQERLREEIKETLDRNGGSIDYEVIKSMEYLDMVFNETLRKYPPLMFLFRRAMEPHTFTDSTNNKLLTIEKDQTIWIPIHAIQNDSRYFPKPEVFDPERFTKEAIESRHPMTYLPFGDGPRNCIGKRFGVMQTKVGLIKILQRYRVETCDETMIPYEINPKAFLLAPTKGIHLRIVKDELSNKL